jgi:hypothetical protein
LTWLGQFFEKGRNVRITDLEWHALEYLAFSMRPVDKHEIFGNLPTDNPLEFAAMVYQATAKNGYGWLGWLNGRPVAALGIFENFPGNWQIWSFGTEDYPLVVVGFLERLTQAIEAARRDHGLHRLECRSIRIHSSAHRLLRVLGFESEGVLRCYGRDRSDYFLFAKVWGDRDDVFWRGRKFSTTSSAGTTAAAAFQDG